MLYRENGQFKTSYAADLQVFPILQDRIAIGLLIALLMGAATLVAQRGAANLETQLWVGILCLQCIPYVAAILCQVAAYMPERKDTAPAGALPSKA